MLLIVHFALCFPLLLQSIVIHEQIQLFRTVFGNFIFFEQADRSYINPSDSQIGINNPIIQLHHAVHDSPGTACPSIEGAGPVRVLRTRTAIVIKTDSSVIRLAGRGIFILIFFWRFSAK